MTEEYYINRANEIVNEKFLLPLLYMIGDINGLSKDKVNLDKNKKYFKLYIINYLKGL